MKISVLTASATIFLLVSPGGSQYSRNSWAPSVSWSPSYLSSLRPQCRVAVRDALPFVTPATLQTLKRSTGSTVARDAPSVPPDQMSRFSCDKRRRRRQAGGGDTTLDGCCLQECTISENIQQATSIIGGRIVNVHREQGLPQVFHICRCRQIPFCGEQTCNCKQEFRVTAAIIRDPDDPAQAKNDFILIPTCCRSEFPSMS